MTTTKKIVFALLFSSTLFSQEMVTDRPDQTESSITVGKNNFQIESGVLFQRSNNNLIKSFFGSSTLVRYGISKGVELRFVSQFESTKIGLDGFDTNYSGLNDLEFGAKVQLLKKPTINTEIAFLSHILLPTGKEKLSANTIGVINKLAISHEINNKMSLGYNVGFDYVEKKNILTYSLVVGVELSRTLGFYIESYGAIGKYLNFERNLDTGFTYLIKNNFQLDVSYGVGLNNDMQYLSTGFSWKIPNILILNKS